MKFILAEEVLGTGGSFFDKVNFQGEIIGSLLTQLLQLLCCRRCLPGEMESLLESLGKSTTTNAVVVCGREDHALRLLQ